MGNKRLGNDWGKLGNVWRRVGEKGGEVGPGKVRGSKRERETRIGPFSLLVAISRGAIRIAVMRSTW